MILARKCSPQTIAMLSALMRHPRVWQHGYEISKATGLKSGTLYPILIGLSDEGLLDSQWQETERPGRPPRHVYRLTVTGMALACDQLQVAEESEFEPQPITAGQQ